MGKQEVPYLPCMLSCRVKAIQSSTLSTAHSGKHRYKERVALKQLIRSSLALLHSRLGTMVRHGDGVQLRQQEKTSHCKWLAQAKSSLLCLWRCFLRKVNVDCTQCTSK